jgi:hypothetical protein
LSKKGGSTSSTASPDLLAQRRKGREVKRKEPLQSWLSHEDG